MTSVFLESTSDIEKEYKETYKIFQRALRTAQSKPLSLTVGDEGIVEIVYKG